MKNQAKIDNKAIGQRIREEREKFTLSRGEFAEIIELSDYYVGQLERGQRQMSLPVLIKVANCLHVSLDYLIFGKKPSHHTSFYVQEINNEYKKCNNIQDHEITDLINKCSPKEFELVKKLIKTVLPYVNKM